MQLRAACVALVAVLLSACGGNARISQGESAASGTSATDNGAADPGTSGGAAPSAGTTSVELGVAGNDNSGAGTVSSGGNAALPPVVHAALPCTNPTPRPHGGGYTACGDGSLRRASAAACDEALPRSAADTPLVFAECTSDADCTASRHGYCAYGACKYGCVTDDECASDEACFCGDFIGVCISANCRSDADCPANYPCTAFQAPGFATAGGLWCQSPQDECVTDSQCSSLNPRVSCQMQLDHRVCFTDPVG